MKQLLTVRIMKGTKRIMNFPISAFFLLAEQSTAEQASTPELFSQMLIFTLPLLALLYFFMIRPERKKQKEAKAMRENLQIGDGVTTVGGIVGIVISRTDDTVLIETGGSRSKIRVKIWAISENLTIHDDAEESGAKNKK